VEVFGAVVYNEEAGEDLAEAVEVAGVVIVDEVIVDVVAGAAGVEDEEAPTQSSSPTDMRGYSSQKAKTTCW
jgi:hypothetical protein